jgi:hypothetical protein
LAMASSLWGASPASTAPVTPTTPCFPFRILMQ